MTQAIARLKALAAESNITLAEFKKAMDKFGFLFQPVKGGTGFSMVFVPNANLLQSKWKGKALAREDVASGTISWKVTLRTPKGNQLVVANTAVPLGRWDRLLALFEKGVKQLKTSAPKPKNKFREGDKVSGKSFANAGGEAALKIAGAPEYSLRQDAWCYPVLIDGPLDYGRRSKTVYLFPAEKLSPRSE